MADTQPQPEKKKIDPASVGFHFHNWTTVRDDGYWYYQACGKCGLRRVKQKESNLTGQPANPLWMKGEEFPVPVGED